MLKIASVNLSRSIFQSCSFCLNQLTCHYRWETCTAASVYPADVISIPFIVYYAYIAINEPMFIRMLRRRLVYKESFIHEVMYV